MLFLKISFIVYLIVLFYVTLLAWNYGASFGPVGPGGRNYNLIPFRSIYRIGIFSKDIMDPIKILIGNIILFIPFGFLPKLILKKKLSVLTITLFGMCLSTLIETCQFLFTYRVSNVDDVILNTLGTFIGALIVAVYFQLKKVIYYFHTDI